ncbi:PTS sugar transporter subunit IIA [Clostridioides difficile]
MESMKIISSNLIFKNIEVSNNEDALKFLGQRLFDEQYVKESYIQAVVAREKSMLQDYQQKYTEWQYHIQI